MINIKKLLLIIIALEVIAIGVVLSLKIIDNNKIRTTINNYVKKVEETNEKTGIVKLNASEVEVDIEHPEEGWLKLQDGKVVEYSLKYKEFTIDLEDGNMTVTKNDIRILPEIIIKIGEDNIVSKNDEVTLKYGKQENKFKVYEVKDDTATLILQDTINESISEYIAKLKNEGFKSVIGGTEDSGNILLSIKIGG